MSKKIAEIEDKNGDIILPVTHERAVYDSDGVRLDEKLNNISVHFLSDFKYALLACFRGCAWVGNNGAALIAALDSAMSSHGAFVGIRANYIASTPVYPDTSLESLRSDISVIGIYEDSTTFPVYNYTLSGTLAVGTSTITVTYENKTDMISVLVIAHKAQYKLSDGDVEKVNGATSWDDTHGAYINTGTISVGRRRSFPVISGERSFRTTTDNETYTDTSIYYPIPIPSDATSVQISITPSTQYFGPAFYTLANGEYTRQLDPGWKQGSNTYQMTAGQYSYLSITSKYNSGGTSYPTEPSELVITFD